MRVGIVLLPELAWSKDRERWQRAETYGFDHAWTFDHLAWRSLADSPWYATIPTLVGAALVTSTIRIGTWVTTPNFRHPVPLAKELMTLDMMSDGRLNVGIGAGSLGWDSTMLGQPPLSGADSIKRLGEFVTLLDQLLTEPVVTTQGEWFSAVDARNIPGTVQRPRPPFIVAANGPKGVRLAVDRAEGWTTNGSAAGSAEPHDWWKGVREIYDRFETTCAAASRSPATLTRMLNLVGLGSAIESAEQFRDYVGHATDIGFTDIVIPWPRPSEPYAGNEDVLDDIAAELSRT